MMSNYYSYSHQPPQLSPTSKQPQHPAYTPYLAYKRHPSAPESALLYQHPYSFPQYQMPAHLPPAPHYTEYMANPLLPPANIEKPVHINRYSHPVAYDPPPAQFTFKTHRKANSYPEMYSNQGVFSCSSSSSSSAASGPKPKKSKTSTLVAKTSINYPIHKLDVGSNHRIPHQKAHQMQESLYPAIEVKKYSTSAIDAVRNYLTVYEYSVNNHWVIWDYSTGFVHLTGIWKASLCASVGDNVTSPPGATASSLKADIVKLLESTPKQYQPYIKRIRGGFLKIQGTWLPFNLCKVLARRFCYYIRYELVPIFGVDFPDYCLKPCDRGFGELKLDEVATDQQPLEYFVPHELHETPEKSKVEEVRSKAKLLPLPQPAYTSTPAYLGSPTSYIPRKTDPVTPINTYLSSYALGAGTTSRCKDNDDMLDIVSASKCLQSLSKPMQSTPNKSYTTKKEGGISTILLAAGLADSKYEMSKTDTKGSEPGRRSSMKINDLLT